MGIFDLFKPNVKKSEEKSDVEGLIKALGYDKYWKIRRDSAIALDKIGWKARNNTERIYYLIAKCKWDSLPELGEEAIEPLIHVLNTEDAYFQNLAIKALVKTIRKTGKYPSHLSSYLKTNNWRRMGIIKVIGETGDKFTTPDLIPLFKDKDYIIYVARAYIKVCVRSGIEYDPNIETLALAVKNYRSYSSLSEGNIKNYLLKMLKDAKKVPTMDNIDITTDSVTGFLEQYYQYLSFPFHYHVEGNFGWYSLVVLEELINPVCLMLSESRTETLTIRDALKSILMRLEINLFQIVRGLSMYDSESLEEISIILGKIGEVYPESLLQALKNDDSKLRSVVGHGLREIGAVKPSIQALKDENWDVREDAVVALAGTCDEGAIDPLVHVALNDISSGVRALAAYNLGRVGDKRAIEPLIQIYNNDVDSAVKSHAKQGLKFIKSKKSW